jgi:hypothetical protein
MYKKIFGLTLILISSSCFAKGGYSSSSFDSYKSSHSTKSTGNGYVNPSSTYTSGYVKNNGTYVSPHMKSASNSTELDNYGTKGNTNPYTGKAGSKYATK